MPEDLRTYKVEFAVQAKDGLVSAQDMIAFLRDKMKVKNCKKIAAREIEFQDAAGSVGITSKQGNITKRNMKLYLKRYLKSKTLKDFVKVSGDGKDSFNLVYINTVEDE